MKIKKVLVVGGASVAGLVAIAVAAVGAMYFTSSSGFDERYEVSAPHAEVTLPQGGAAMAEGERLFLSRGCGDCHGEDAGGRMFFEGGPLGKMYAPNLTRLAEAYGYEDFERIVRHGVRRDGSPVLFMPAHEYWMMPDRELAHIVAYLKSLDVVDRENQPTELGLLAHVLNAADKLVLLPATRVDHAAEHPQVDAAPTAEYGEVLAQGCKGCHGDGLAGGPIPGTPPDFPVPTNITPHDTGLAGWGEADLARALREGKRPDGRPIDPFMPAKVYKHLNDTEISALWAYLSTVEPAPFGER